MLTENNKLGINDNKYKDDSAQVVAQNEVTTKTLRLEAVASSSTSTSVSRTSNQLRLDCVKLHKQACPRFLGEASEFVKLKRELSAIVNMEGRTLKEIGYNLHHAIPNKHRHLIQNPNINDHKEMMEAIVNKFSHNWKVSQSDKHDEANHRGQNLYRFCVEDGKVCP